MIIYVFGSSTKFQRGMTGFVKADICRQVSFCLRVFCGISFALKPFRDYSLYSVCILPQPAFYSQSVVCILHSVCILPLVRSLQSAVRSLRFTLTDLFTMVSDSEPKPRLVRLFSGVTVLLSVLPLKLQIPTTPVTSFMVL